MDDSRIAFKGTLQQLLEKVEKGEMVPKLQASHAPPCKFWTAFQVLNGIRHMAPVIHGPKGCTYSVASAYKMTSCEYRGVPLEPTTCTAQDEVDVVYGGEGKLLEAVKEAERRYHPELIVIFSCCCSGIVGDDVETIAQRADREVSARVLAIRSEGFGGGVGGGRPAEKLANIWHGRPPKRSSSSVASTRPQQDGHWRGSELPLLVQSLGQDKQ